MTEAASEPSTDEDGGADGDRIAAEPTAPVTSTADEPIAAVHSRTAALVLLVLLSLVWGLHWVVVKIGLDYMPPLTYAALRVLTGLATVVAVLAWKRRLRLPERSNVPIVLSVGLAQIAAGVVLMTLALQVVPAGRSSVLVYTMPIWVAVLLAVFFGIRPRRNELVGLVLGIGGLIVLLNPAVIDWGSSGELVGTAGAAAQRDPVGGGHDPRPPPPLDAVAARPAAVAAARRPRAPRDRRPRRRTRAGDHLGTRHDPRAAVQRPARDRVRDVGEPVDHPLARPAGVGDGLPRRPGRRPALGLADPRRGARPARRRSGSRSCSAASGSPRWSPSGKAVSFGQGRAVAAFGRIAWQLDARGSDSRSASSPRCSRRPAPSPQIRRPRRRRPTPATSAATHRPAKEASGRVLVRFKPSASPASRRLALQSAGATTDGIKGLATGTDDLAPHLVPGPRGRRDRPPRRRRRRPAQRAARRRHRRARPGHHRRADAQRPEPARRVGPRPAERRRHRREGGLGHDDRQPRRDRRRHRLRHRPRPPRPRREHLDQPGRDRGQRDRRRRRRLRRRRARLGLRRRRQPARRPVRARDARLGHRRRGRQQRDRRRRRRVHEQGACPCGSSTPTARATSRTRSGRSTSRPATASGSRTTAGATSAPPPRCCPTRSRPRATPGSSWSSRPATRAPTSTRSPNYPAAYDLPNIISVAATDQDDQLAQFSNVGAIGVDIAAPGDVILSTEPSGYGYSSGTSMASPHVAGVAALVLSLHPTWTVAQIRDRILQTARPIAALEGVIATGGMVNAAAAVGGAGRQPRAGREDHEPGLGHLGPARLEGHVHGDGGRSRAGQRRVVDQLGVEPAGRDRLGRVDHAQRPRRRHARHRRDRARRRPQHAARGDPAADRTGGAHDRRPRRPAHAGDRGHARRDPGAHVDRAGDRDGREPPHGGSAGHTRSSRTARTTAGPTRSSTPTAPSGSPSSATGPTRVPSATAGSSSRRTTAPGRGPAGRTRASARAAATTPSAAASTGPRRSRSTRPGSSRSPGRGRRSPASRSRATGRGCGSAVEHANGSWTSTLAVAAPDGVERTRPRDRARRERPRRVRPLRQRPRGRVRGDQRDRVVGRDADRAPGGRDAASAGPGSP